MTVEILSDGCTEVLMIRKRVKNINLRVSKGRVICTFPYGVDKKYVRDFLERKSDWIKLVSEKQKSQNNYLMGYIRKDDKLQLLGSLYTIIERQEKNNTVKIVGDTIVLSVKDLKDEELKDRVLSKWWKELAYITFDSLIDKWLITLNEYNFVKPYIGVRKMKSRWGSCNKTKGRITFNEYLLKAEVRAVEYVVLHELAHLKIRAHDKAFYTLIEKFMPDYKVRKKALMNDLLQG
ncbi:MAG: hypothetical protein BWX72_02033 [Firmicutes bacterium ADurb.Bin080]|jgi:predicted metal-dependent hydrolase|nr:M48 family metallopeptidase [Clostridiales bacterium]OQC12196.1 MAG: hypothetical protein BWX72_02033 [Firmicutes bacterium ADurb.Bin080]